MRSIKVILFMSSLFGVFFLISQAARVRRVYGAPAASATFQAQSIIQVSPTSQPTQTPIPSATVDYQSTAIVAQQTADEARRVNAVVTSQFEQMVMEQVRITAEYEQRVQQVYAWTKEAAGTSIPLTATQQVIVNTQSVQQQQFIYAQMTSTEHAPTQMVAISNAEASARYAKVNAIVRIFALAALGFLCIGLVLFLFIYIPNITANQDDADTQPDEITVTIKRDNGNGSTKYTPTTLPCTRAQLNELAELAINGERTFAISRLESRVLPRNVLYAFRKFLTHNELAIVSNVEGDEIALNDDGLHVLAAWFDYKELPDGWELGGEDAAHDE